MRECYSDYFPSTFFYDSRGIRYAKSYCVRFPLDSVRLKCAQHLAGPGDIRRNSDDV